MGPKRSFWAERWREQRIGFHEASVNPLLVRYLPTLELPESSRVFVPLAGKSVDMAWLIAQGLEVVGVEWVEQAIQQFFGEQALPYAQRRSPPFTVYECEGLALYCGDFFDLDPDTLGPFDLVWDRAAMIAMDEGQRAAYVPHLLRLLGKRGRILLVTVEYDSSEMEGPPYSVSEEEVRRLYAPSTEVELVKRNSVLDDSPQFQSRGLSRMDSVVWKISKP
jgi:thiopurine S-methyltransferase